MEFFTIFLSSFLSIFVTSGIFVDRAIEKNIRQRIKNAETLQVRIDNRPSYQLLNGKIDKLRIAGRGLEITDYLTIDQLELETDFLDLNLKKINSSENWREILNQPFQGGINLTFSETELNETLQSETVLNWLNKFIARLSQGRNGTSNLNYQLLNPQIQFEDENRLIFEAELLSSSSRRLKIKLDTKLQLIKGHTIKIVDITGTINDKPLSKQLLNRISETLTSFLDLKKAEKQGVILRILNLNINQEKIDLSAFLAIQNLNK